MVAEQVKLLLRQPDIETVLGARDYAILCFLFYTSSRIGSSRSIRIKDFYQDKGIQVLRSKKKGGASQGVPVHPELQTALLHYLDKSDHRNNPNAPLFHSIRRDKNKGEPLPTKTFVYIRNKYRKKAGLPEQFTPHSSLATFATTADGQRVPIQYIQATLSHANIYTTQAYIHSRKLYKDSAVFSVKY